MPGEDDQFATLASYAVEFGSLDEPGDVALLLQALRAAGADEQVSALLDRDPAAHASLDNWVTLSYLLNALREAGVSAPTALIERLPATGAFGLFAGRKAARNGSGFGREADGRSAKP